jgi:AhpD family alkylhydroperoxidase
MEARMTNPVAVLPDAMTAIQQLNKAAQVAGVPQSLMELVHMRASQINGCCACISWGVQSARKGGESDDRLLLLSAWREADCFSDAERAALALTEAATRLADRPGAVTDEIWDEAARHFDEKELAAIILTIGVTNLFNRLNTTVRQPVSTFAP